MPEAPQEAFRASDRRGQLKWRVSIDERPEVVTERSRIGAWEADTVIGKQGGAVLVTLIERKICRSVIGKRAFPTGQRTR